jgi:hypothetical protein
VRKSGSTPPCTCRLRKPTFLQHAAYAHCHLNPTGRDAWTAMLGPDSAQSAVRAVHAWLVKRAQLYRSLALLLEVAVPAPIDTQPNSTPAARQTPPPGTPPLQQTVPTAEALTTILTSRNLTGTGQPASGIDLFRVASGSNSTCLTAAGLTAGRIQNSLLRARQTRNPMRSSHRCCACRCSGGARRRCGRSPRRWRARRPPGWRRCRRSSCCRHWPPAP